MAASLIIDSFRNFYESLVAKLPQIGVALLVILVSYIIARMIRVATRKALARLSTTAHLDVLLSRFISYIVIGLGVIVALGVIGVNMGALIASLGLVSVGLGFAIRDVISNFIAGVILILQRPYKIGDSVTLGEVEGIVEDIRVRDTIIRRNDGRLVFIPNTNIFNNNINNNSLAVARRSEFVISIPLKEDLEKAVGLIRSSLGEVDGILAQPSPQVGAESIDDERFVIRALYWADPAADLFALKTQAINASIKSLSSSGLLPTEEDV